MWCRFGINYNNEPAVYRKGTTIVRAAITDGDGTPIPSDTMDGRAPDAAAAPAKACIEDASSMMPFAAPVCDTDASRALGSTAHSAASTPQLSGSVGGSGGCDGSSGNDGVGGVGGGGGGGGDGGAGGRGHDRGAAGKGMRARARVKTALVTEHGDIIGDAFWVKHRRDIFDK